MRKLSTDAEPPGAASGGPVETVSDATLRALIETASQAILTVNGAARILTANHKTAAMFGYASGTLPGQPLAVILPSETVEPRKRPAGVRVEADGRRKDGTTIPVELWFSHINTPGGAVSLVFARDISERRRAYARLLDYEHVVEGLDDMLVIVDRNYRYLIANRAFLNYRNRTRDQIIGRSVRDLVGAELFEREVKPRFDECLRGRVVKFELSYTYPQLGERDLSLSYFPIEGPAGVDRIGCLLQDITARNRAESQLRRSEAYLAESQRLSRIGSWGLKVGADGQPQELVFWSAEHYRILGFDPLAGPVSAADALKRVHPDDLPAANRLMQDAMREAKDYEIDFRIVMPDGAVRHCHSIGHPVLNAAGALVEYMGTIMDVTETKLAEEERRQSFDRLRALAARLENAREEERRRVAREVHDELGQALTAIKMDVAALLHGLPPEQTDQVKRAESILALADETIHSVRRIATELRPSVLDDLGLVAAVEWAAEEFQSRTGVKCSVTLPDADTVMEPERATALFRIFQETLTNIARHARATRVDVRLTQRPDALSLEVKDNGVGFDESRLAAGQSLGVLGMRERALLVGGALTIHGIGGRGTTVSVRIPHLTGHSEGTGK